MRRGSPRGRVRRGPTLSLDLGAPDPVASGACAGSPVPAEQALAYAARAADALTGEAVGRRFFREFRSAWTGWPKAFPDAARARIAGPRAASAHPRALPLFHPGQGMARRPRPVPRRTVDACLGRGRRFHRDLLRPLFFGTLNRPAPERGRIATLLRRHPVPQRRPVRAPPAGAPLRGDIPNPIWRDAFDRLFERFHFTVSEAPGDGTRSRRTCWAGCSRA